VNRSRLAVLALLAVAVPAACGGDDDGGSAATQPPAATVPSPGGGGGGPVAPVQPPTATVPADVPDGFLPAIGPVDVTGESLPVLDKAPIDRDPGRGLTAPSLVGLGYDGQPVRIDAATDGPTMVVFLAHWCPHCNAEVPRLIELRDAGRFPDWLNIVAVATASNPQRPNFPPGDWLANADWTWPALADGVDLEAESWVGATAFGVDGFPFIALLDADGKVAARWSGESTPDEIIARITQYLG